MKTDPARISRYTIPSGTPTWIPLPWPGTCISTSLAGDLGPSGHDEGGRSRRTAAYASLSFFPISSQNVLICKQVHSLRVLVLSQGLPARVVEGRWDEASQRVLSVHASP